MRRLLTLSAILLLALATSAPLLAYNPPVDTAGPLAVKIEGPETIDQTDAPTAIRVVFENKGDQPLSGTLRMGVVDRWTLEPAGELAFEVAAQQTTTKEFKLSAGEPTYNGHYPVHAYARFTLAGQQHEAHPILVFETKLPLARRPPPALDWNAFSVAPDSGLALWRLPVRRMVMQVFGEAAETMPVGWEGNHADHRGSVQFGEQRIEENRKDAIGIHPPWRNGRVGTALVEYPLALPSGKVSLQFATAMSPSGDGGDGVTFRVRAVDFDAPAGELGRVLFERHSADKKWQEAEVDLSAFAGRRIRLQLESHPGPKNNTAFDLSFWAEPTIIAGTPPAAPAFPPRGVEGSIVLGSLQTDAADPQAYQVRVWKGRRGLLDSIVGIGQGDALVCFRGFEVRVLGNRLDDPRSPVQLLEVKEEDADGGLQRRHRFESPWGKFDLVGRLWIENQMLHARWWLDGAPAPRPWLHCRIEDTSTGPWSHDLLHVYAGHGNVLRRPADFTLNFDGHRLATSFVGFDFEKAFAIVQATSPAPDRLEIRPAARHFSLHATHAPAFTFVPAADAFVAVRHWRQHNGLKPAGGVTKLAGRFVFDLWGGQYGDSSRQLERAFAYGLTDACVVWHNWQRWGYDYRLPDIMPPNPKLGTPDEFRRLRDVCHRQGVLFAPHDNYIDFYPDADGFSYEKQIAFSGNGEPVKAWLNEGRGARSYRFRADTLAPFVKRNIEWLHREFAPTAYFIDVWSSINPYDYWTADGRFVDRVYTNRVWGEQFAWIRDALGDNAPQISESGQDALIGWLDGAQTNHLRVGKALPGKYQWSVWDWKCEAAERTPWFDVAHHNRFIMHGAGYSARYEAGLDSRMHGIMSDDYIATEVLTGHPAMAPVPFGRDVVRKYWLTQELMRALALRTIEKVEYVDGDLGRQRIVWSGDGEVWVNRGQSDWKLADCTLPPYGFLAKVRTPQGEVEAALERRDGVVVERVRSPRMIYVNGRQLFDGRVNVTAEVEKAELTGDRQVQLSLLWRLGEPVPEGYRPFLHLCDVDGEIVAQAGFDADSILNRKGEVRVTAGFTWPVAQKPDEPLELRIGFYQPQGGSRLALVGPDDGGRRVRLGSIAAKGDQQRLAEVAWNANRDLEAADPWLARQNAEGKPIDFGAVETSAAVRIVPTADGLIVTPLPSTRGPKFAVRIAPSRLGWKLPVLKNVATLGEDGAAGEPRPLARDGETLVIECEPGVFGYRLTP